MLKQSKKWLTRHWLKLLFMGSLTLCIGLGQLPPAPFSMGWVKIVMAQSNPEQLVRQGVEQYRQGNYQEAIVPWQQALTIYGQMGDYASSAIIQENLARTVQNLGQLTQALTYWEQTIAHYRQIGDSQKVGRLLTDQAQTYIKLGQQRQAIALLCGEEQDNKTCDPNSALAIAQALNDQQGEAAALGSLGEAYRLRGNYTQAINYLKQAEQLNYPVYQVAVANSLGNAYLSEGQLWSRRAKSAQVRAAAEPASQFQAQATQNYEQALKAYNNSLALAQSQNNSLGQMRVLLNLLQLDVQVPTFQLENNVLEKALELFQSLPNTPEKVYAAIDLALASTNSISPLTQCTATRRLPEVETESLLKEAIEIARNLEIIAPSHLL